jgi:hypothetical protein
MKIATASKSLVLTLALLVASSAFASTKGSLQLSNPVSVNGTTLKAGDYKVEWAGTGADVEVSILQGNKVLAKVPGHVVELKNPSANNAAVTQPGSGPVNSLAGIRFAGKTMALELGNTSEGMQGGSSK